MQLQPIPLQNHQVSQSDSQYDQHKQQNNQSLPQNTKVINEIFKEMTVREALLGNGSSCYVVTVNRDGALKCVSTSSASTSQETAETETEEQYLEKQWSKNRRYDDLIPYIYVLVENHQCEKALSVLDKASHLKNLGYLRSVVLFAQNKTQDAKSEINQHLMHHNNDFEALFWACYYAKFVSKSQVLNKNHSFLLRIFDGRAIDHDKEFILKNSFLEKNIWVLIVYLHFYAQNRAFAAPMSIICANLKEQLQQQSKNITPFFQRFVIYCTSMHKHELMWKIAECVCSIPYSNHPNSTTAQLCFAASLVQQKKEIPQDLLQYFNQNKTTSERHRLFVLAYEMMHNEIPKSQNGALQTFVSFLAADMPTYEGWLYIVNSLFKEVVSYSDLIFFSLKKTNAACPENLWGHFHLGMYYKSKNKTTECIEELKKISLLQSERDIEPRLLTLFPIACMYLYNAGEYTHAYHLSKYAKTEEDAHNMRLQHLLFSCVALCSEDYAFAKENAMHIIESFRSESNDKVCEPYRCKEHKDCTPQNVQADAWCCYFIAIALEKKEIFEKENPAGLKNKLQIAEQFERNKSNLIFQKTKLLVLHRLGEKEKVCALLHTQHARSCEITHRQLPQEASLPSRSFLLFSEIQTYEEYETLNPPCKKICKLFLLRKITLAKNDQEKAHARQMLLTLDPDDLDNKHEVISYLFDCNQSDEAVALLQEIPLNSCKSELLMKALCVYFEKGDTNLLAFIGQHYAQEKTDNPFLLVAQAEHAFSQNKKKKQRALELLEKAYALMPDSRIENRLQEFRGQLPPKPIFLQAQIKTVQQTPHFMETAVTEEKKGPRRVGQPENKKRADEINKALELKRKERDQKKKEKKIQACTVVSSTSRVSVPRECTTATQAAAASSVLEPSPIIEFINNGGILVAPETYKIQAPRAQGSDVLGLIKSSQTYLQGLIDCNGRAHIKGAKGNALLYYAIRLFETVKQVPGFSQLATMRNFLRHGSRAVTLEKLETLVKNLHASKLKECLQKLQNQTVTCELKLCAFSHERPANELEYIDFFIQQLEVAEKVNFFVKKQNTGKTFLDSDGDLKASLMGCCLLLSEAFSSALKAEHLKIEYPADIKEDVQQIIHIGNKIAHEIGELDMLWYAARDEVTVEELFQFMEKSSHIKASFELQQLEHDIDALKIP